MTARCPECARLERKFTHARIYNPAALLDVMRERYEHQRDEHGIPLIEDDKQCLWGWRISVQETMRVETRP